jgi:lipopolysaccharide export system permease protein
MFISIIHCLIFLKLLVEFYLLHFFLALLIPWIKYEANNELIIFWNHGVSKLSIVNFFFWVAILIMFIQILLLSFVVPKSQELARLKLRSSDIDYFEGLIKPKKFNDTIKGLTIFAEEKDDNNEFKNIYIKKKNKNKGFQITFAKKGVFELKSNKRVLVLYDGQTLTQNNENITNFYFSKSDFGLSNMDSHLVTYEKIQDQSTLTLITCIQSIFEREKNNVVNCKSPRNIYKEFFKRVINPLYLPLLILVSSLLILNTKENQKYNRNKYFIFLVGFGVIILSESSLGYIANEIKKNISIIILPLILTIIVYLFFIFKLRLSSKKL